MKLKEVFEINSTKKFRLQGCEAKKCGRNFSVLEEHLTGALGYCSGTSVASVMTKIVHEVTYRENLFRYSNHTKYLFTYLPSYLLTYLLAYLLT